MLTKEEWVEGITKEVGICKDSNLDQVYRELCTHLAGYAVAPSLSHLAKFGNEIIIPLVSWHPCELIGAYISINKRAIDDETVEWSCTFHESGFVDHIKGLMTTSSMKSLFDGFFMR